MEPAEYLAWLDGREDSEELRSEWALSKQDWAVLLGGFSIYTPARTALPLPRYAEAAR